MGETRNVFRVLFGKSVGRQRIMRRGTLLKRKFGYNRHHPLDNYEGDGARSGYCPTPTFSYDGDDAAGCVTD